jgi:hypothetical protein
MGSFAETYSEGEWFQKMNLSDGHQAENYVIQLLVADLIFSVE